MRVVRKQTSSSSQDIIFVGIRGRVHLADFNSLYVMPRIDARQKLSPGTIFLGPRIFLVKKFDESSQLDTNIY